MVRGREGRHAQLRADTAETVWAGARTAQGDPPPTVSRGVGLLTVVREGGVYEFVTVENAEPLRPATSTSHATPPPTPGTLLQVTRTLPTSTAQDVAVYRVPSALR